MSQSHYKMHELPEMNFRESDGYAGISWAQRAQLDGLRAVLDPADAGGKKNAYIDAIHYSAIKTLLQDTASYGRALDFGCGVGRFLPLLASFANEVYGVDRTPEMVEIARKNGAIPAEQLVLCRDGHLPFDDGTFDVILCVYVLSCVPELDARHSLSELRRVAKPGCRLILIEQIAPARGLNSEYYYTLLRNAGFHVGDEKAIRPGASLFSSLVGRPWFPRFLIPTWAAFMRLITPRRRCSYAEYFDCAMVAMPIEVPHAASE